MHGGSINDGTTSLTAIKNLQHNKKRGTVDTMDVAITNYRKDLARVVTIAASKVEKKPKEETNLEKFRRISEEKEAKRVKGVKKAAKSLVKKKEMKSLTTYFKKK